MFRALALAAIAMLLLPFAALLLDLPWTRLGELLGSETLLAAARISLVVVPIATAIVAVLGTPLAWLLARTSGPLTTGLRTLVLLPVVLPPVVAGLVLLSAFGRRGLLGSALESVGVVLPFSTAGAVLTAAFVSLPFYVLAAEAGFRDIPAARFDAARMLGDSDTDGLLKLGLPGARDAIVAGLLLAAARALGEFGATITFAGNIEGATRTLPLATFAALQSDPDLARVIGVVLLVFAGVTIWVLRRSLLRPRL